MPMAEDIEVKPIPKKVFKSLKQFTQDVQASIKAIYEPVGIMLGIADKFGALQPIMDVFQGLVDLIGGSIMQAMIPGLQQLVDVLFSDEMMEVWTILGETIGTFLSFVLGEIAKLLQNPAFRKLLETFVLIFQNVVGVLMAILKPLFDWLGSLSPQQLGLVFYILGLGISMLMGMSQLNGPWGAAIYGAIWAIAAAPLLAMQKGGIVNAPTIALIGEAGREAVVPLDEGEDFGGGEVTVNITGGVFAQDERELARTIAKTIRLYRF